MLIIYTSSNAQDILILMQKNKKQILIKSGQEIRFRLKGEKHFNKERITSLEEGLIFLETTIIKMEEIDVIDIRGHKKTAFNINSYAQALPFAGIAYIGVDQFNRVVIDGNSFHISGNTLRIAGSLILIGKLIKLTERKYFKPKTKNKMKILKDFD